MMGVPTYEEPGWTFHPDAENMESALRGVRLAPLPTTARGRRNSASPSTPTGRPTMRNGRSIDACGAANPEPRILHAELALFVRLRHLSVSPTGE